MQKRNLGQALVSPLGMGCWAIGGPFWEGDKPLGWGAVDDKQSLRAIHAGIDAGINFIDTANIYGAGHSEVVIGKAIAGRRDQVVLSSKVGFDCDTQTKQVLGAFSTPEKIRNMLDASLQRLGTDYLDILFLHIGDLAVDEAMKVRDVLEALIKEGKINSFGWSTDLIDRAECFVQNPGCAAIQFELNVFNPNAEMVSLCEHHQVAAINRGPLAMGLLSGKYRHGTVVSDSDIRKVSPDWLKYFKDGRPSPELTTRLDAVREILTSDNRTLSQGALAWLWAISPNNIPIPGFRTVEQITLNAMAMEKGPLTPSQVSEIHQLAN
ncbi:aldo/keto reductase [Vibrio sp. WXL210]|uniref:aldo/keto reductase n=1 Tax=Vibrio sp. WXL210 TaxID=3450709 RepID=UPI003EC4D306